MNFGEAVATVVQSIVLPYGYTLSIWSAGILGGVQIRCAETGRPAAVRGGSGDRLHAVQHPDLLGDISGQEQLDVEVPTVALLNIVPLAAVVVSTLLMRLIESEKWGYFLSGFSATVVYLGSLSLLLWALG